MSKIIIGKVRGENGQSAIPRGEYDNSTTYNSPDLVTYNNDLYIALQETTGNLPTDSMFWRLCIKGAKQVPEGVTYVDLQSEDSEQLPNRIPVDADTLDGNPPEYFATKQEITSILKEFSKWQVFQINPNILINSNFKINQRGQKNYITSGTAQIYTFDRWKTFQNAENTVKVRRITDEVCGVYIESNGKGWTLGQYIENFEDFAGKTVTISAKIQDMLGGWQVCVSDTENSYHSLDFDNVIDGIVQKTLILSKDITRLLTCFYFTDSLDDGSGWIGVEWVKLELGETVTPYIPPDPSTELMRCQRYYFASSDEQATTIMLLDDDYTVGKRFFFPTTMRVYPTITLSGEGNSAVLTANNLDFYTKNGFDCNGKELTSGSWYVQFVEADAEIY